MVQPITIHKTQSSHYNEPHQVGVRTETWVDGVGREIKRLRDAKDWTGAQLAVYAGMSPSAVSQIETGRRSANTASLTKLADALGVGVADLFPRVQAPLPLDADAKAGLSSLTDIPQDEFLRRLSSAVSDEALLELFGRMDAERTHLELAFRDDEGDIKSRNTFARAVQRRMMVFLTLIERGIAPPDPEKIRLAEQLDNVLRSSR